MFLYHIGPKTTATDIGGISLDTMHRCECSVCPNDRRASQLVSAVTCNVRLGVSSGPARLTEMSGRPAESAALGADIVRRASTAPWVRSTLPAQESSAPLASTFRSARRNCPRLALSDPSATATGSAPAASAASIRSPTRAASIGKP